MRTGDIKMTALDIAVVIVYFVGMLTVGLVVRVMQKS